MMFLLGVLLGMFSGAAAVATFSNDDDNEQYKQGWRDAMNQKNTPEKREQ